MNLIVTVFILHLVTQSYAANITEEASTNKTKRTVGAQVHNYGENRPVMLYADNSGPLPQTLASLYSPVTLNPDVPKQVAAQQVLYEFQQTPTNAVSNVHVNQFYQPLQGKPESAAPTNTGPAQFLSSSESVATPVQHSSLVRHGQNYAQVQLPNYQIGGTPQHVQTHQYIPGKYLYVNGKIIYQPNGQQGNLQQQNGYQQNGYQQRPAGFLYTHPQAGTQRFMPQVPIVRPMGYRHFQPPQPNQFQPITKPMGAPEANEEQNEEEADEETAPKEDEEVEEENDEEESHDESDDGERYFGKYAFDEEEDNDHYEEEDEDNERGSSKPVPKKQRKGEKPNKYNKSSNFKYAENYSSSSKYEKPVKKGKKSVKNPKMHYKAVKYTKEGNGKPRIERIEGRQSENIPVIHKQKIFKEKWYVTKSTDDSKK